MTHRCRRSRQPHSPRSCHSQRSRRDSRLNNISILSILSILSHHYHHHLSNSRSVEVSPHSTSSLARQRILSPLQPARRRSMHLLPCPQSPLSKRILSTTPPTIFSTTVSCKRTTLSRLHRLLLVKVVESQVQETTSSRAPSTSPSLAAHRNPLDQSIHPYGVQATRMNPTMPPQVPQSGASLAALVATAKVPMLRSSSLPQASSTSRIAHSPRVIAPTNLPATMPSSAKVNQTCMLALSSRHLNT